MPQSCVPTTLHGIWKQKEPNRVHTFVNGRENATFEVWLSILEW